MRRRSTLPTRLHPASGPRRRARGFTLLEILVTVGIILILMGLVLFALRRVTTSAKGGTTRAALGTAKGLLTEYDLQVKSNRNQPPSVWCYQTGGTPQAKAVIEKKNAGVPKIYFDLWQGVYDNASDNINERGGVRAPGPMEGGAKFPASGVVERTGSPAIRNTGMVMLYLSKIAGNRKVLDALPADQHHIATDEWKTAVQYQPGMRVAYIDRAKTPAEFSFYLCTTATSSAVPGSGGGSSWQEIESTLLDSWGNPIIFVPADGLQLWWDWTERPDTRIGIISRSSGQFYRRIKNTGLSPGSNNDWEQVPPAAGVIKSPDGKPFFASAGPDGDFRTTDDNLYSFED